VILVATVFDGPSNVRVGNVLLGDHSTRRSVLILDL
jgi:hypothetical protein